MSALPAPVIDYDHHESIADEFWRQWATNQEDKQVLENIQINIPHGILMEPYMKGEFKIGKYYGGPDYPDSVIEYRMISYQRHPDQDGWHDTAFLCSFTCTYHPTPEEWDERYRDDLDFWEHENAEYFRQDHND